MRISAISVDFKPDLIIVSPMRRTIETAFAAFTPVDNEPLPIEVWPDLREAHDAVATTVRRLLFFRKNTPISISQSVIPNGRMGNILILEPNDEPSVCAED